MPTPIEYFESKESIILRNYFAYLSFESISAHSSSASEVIKCKDWIKDYLIGLGFEVETWETSGLPSLFAQRGAGGNGTISEGKETVLIYGHFDVQPVDPIDSWISPPFKPQLRDGEIYARGAVDNKGQNFYSILALEYLLSESQRLPVNIKLLFDGEEEVGSPGLSAMVASKRELLRADHLLVVDLGIPSMSNPTICLGIRGIVKLKVEVEGSPVDLHSGSFGGIATNPLHALVELLGKVRNDKGTIMIPGFYDDVDETPMLRESWVEYSPSREDYENQSRFSPCGGEKNYPINARAWLRPTLEINGISGGYTGDGFKTVIPARACAHISCRLVSNQVPATIAQQITEFMKRNICDGVQLKIQVMPGTGFPKTTTPDSRTAKCTRLAFEDIFGIPCGFAMEGLSIPIASKLAEVSGAELALFGLGLPNDGAHAPNEHFSAQRLKMGYLLMVNLLKRLGN